MPERTKRGEEDRKREDDKMTGEPVEAAKENTGTQVANTTRDQGVEPMKDVGRGDKTS
jgi:hypothetical protein